MQIVYSDAHLRHTDRVEPLGSRIVPVSEVPERATAMIEAVTARGLGEIAKLRDFGLAPIHAVHPPRYVEFLAAAWRLWAAQGRSGPLLPNFWRPRISRMKPGADIYQMIDYYSGDPGACLVEGSWNAILASANCAATAAEIVAGAGSVAFALCRPPGHHAGHDRMRGSCYLNNAAIAARRLRRNGAHKVAIVDIDYHHGNGTQEIFYEASDVLTCSIHVDPTLDYPFYAGFADEIGKGGGKGFNLSLVLQRDAAFTQWAVALAACLQRVRDFDADALVIAPGSTPTRTSQTPRATSGWRAKTISVSGNPWANSIFPP
ncbi:histone deacetylase family protein [Mesorhizobium sp. M0091]|uniref:histone deacetylase family protein n=1 Tax=Mesorhizobium sp. M0091 TaxID=2956875 RepID=UPI00333AEB62